MNDKESSPPNRFLGAICHHCPLCRFGRKRPGSLIGRLLHHPLHAENCPFWKAEKDLYGQSDDG
ncbi:MAG: hypothetical protein ABII00_15995 [Elusimicrobiota bacterium]